MTSPLSRRLEKLEAMTRDRSLTNLSDAELAARIRDLWLEAVADGPVSDELATQMVETARLFGVELRPGETPMDLWSRVRPALDEVVERRTAAGGR